MHAGRVAGSSSSSSCQVSYTPVRVHLDGDRHLRRRQRTHRQQRPGDGLCVAAPDQDDIQLRVSPRLRATRRRPAPRLSSTPAQGRPARRPARWCSPATRPTASPTTAPARYSPVDSKTASCTTTYTPTHRAQQAQHHRPLPGQRHPRRQRRQQRDHRHLEQRRSQICSPGRYQDRPGTCVVTPSRS